MIENITLQNITLEPWRAYCIFILICLIISLEHRGLCFVCDFGPGHVSTLVADNLEIIQNYSPRSFRFSRILTPSTLPRTLDISRFHCTQLRSFELNIRIFRIGEPTLYPTLPKNLPADISFDLSMPLITESHFQKVSTLTICTFVKN